MKKYRLGFTFREIYKAYNYLDGHYFDIQLLPQIGIALWRPTETDKRYINGVYLCWLLWSVLIYIEVKQ